MSYFYDEPEPDFEREAFLKEEAFMARREKLKQEFREKPVWRAGELAKELPSTFEALNDLLLTEEVTAHVEIKAEGIIFHMSPDEISPCGHTVCISVKYSRWDDAENDAYLLKKSGYDAWVDTESDKPHLVAELKPSDTIRFTVSEF